ncbi:MFS transporter [Luteimicrobium subarcticum]|uniref:Putative MFS family arabinose efflux permease n=1 Tax=Luteimicrobium subarcticum TaxID=620910 RepID=A0A2M8WJM6_9MICO|nr:MFS transporter [Luteimicrobium subarcticum]PJI91137.1 putative MFS family arabinose efflux permease [Luteimicrobium subarcticum]
MTNVALRRASTERQAGVWQAVPLLAASTMPVLGSVLITPVLPQISDHFEHTAGSAVLVPLIVALPALMIALFAPFAGQVADRFARKSLLLVALVVYAVVGIAPALMDDLRLILVSRALVGLCEAAIMTVATALIVDYFPDERRRNEYLGLQAVTTTLAATVFVAVGGALGANSWHTPFWVYAAGLVIALPVAVSLWEPEPDEVLRSEQTRVPAVPWSALRLPLLVTLFGGTTFSVLVVELSYVVVDTGIDEKNTAVIGAVAAAASLATAAGGLAFRRVARFTPTRLLPAAFALQAVGMVVVWLAPGLPVVVAGAIVASVGSGLLLPTMVVWVVASQPFEQRGRVSGLWNSAFFGGQFLAPLVATGVAAAVGGLAGAVGVIGALALAVALLLRWQGTPSSTQVPTADA